MSYPQKLEVAQEWQRTANLSSGKPQTIENKLKRQRLKIHRNWISQISIVLSVLRFTMSD
jgi:hypothetical protein